MLTPEIIFDNIERNRGKIKEYGVRRIGLKL